MKWILGLGGILLLANEIRGAIMAGPILVAMFVTGPTWVQVIILLSIIASVLIPGVIYGYYRRKNKVNKL